MSTEIKGLGNKYVALQRPPAHARSYYYRTIIENGQVKNDILQGSPMNFSFSLVERDVNGRAKVNDPEDEADIVNKRTMKREIAPIEEKLKQVKFAFAFNSYDDVVTKFNSYNKADDTFHIGQDVFVRTQNVPDLWISGISDTKNTYNYTNDAAFVEEITSKGIIQIGYVVFSALESKTVLGDYASVEDLAAIKETVKNLENAVADLLYVPISISSFSASAIETNSGDTTPYKGDLVTEVYLSWSTNKTPDTLKLDNNDLDSTDTSKTETTGINYTSTKKWTLTATDDRKTVSKEASITFYDAVHYGVASVGTYDSTFIKALSKKVASNSKPTISGITGQTGKYLFYCIPSSRGECSFTDNDTGFPFAMEKVATGVGYSNGNYTTTYDVYKSINSISGSISVTVK